MTASGTITGSSVLKAGTDPQTSDVDTLALGPTAVIAAETNTIAEIRIDVPDTLAGSDLEITFTLGTSISSSVGSGPTPVMAIKDRRDGTDDDYEVIRAFCIMLVPTVPIADPSVTASGRCVATIGDPSDPDFYFSVPLELNYDQDVDNNPVPSWTGAIPEGLEFNTSFPLTVTFREGLSNENMSAIINLLGN